MEFLNEELRQAGYTEIHCPKIDTVELAQILLPTADSYKLRDLAKNMNSSMINHTVRIVMLLQQRNYFTILNEIEKLPLVTLQSLYELSDVFQSDIADVLSENILKKVMHGKEEIAEYEVHRNIAPRKRNYSLSIGEPCSLKFDAFLNKTMDKLKLHMPKFERRESQQMMMKEIYTALRDSRFLLLKRVQGLERLLLIYFLVFILQRKRRTCHYQYTDGTTSTTNIGKRNSVITKNNAICI